MVSNCLLKNAKFVQSSVRYLGHVISERGVETDPEKISALKTWPIPKTLKELKSFLGSACSNKKARHMSV